MSSELLGEPAIKHARRYKMKDSYYYYVNNDIFDELLYVCVSIPEKPIHVSELSAEIREILMTQRIDIDANETHEFSIRTLL